jgi:hypothetical protein
MDALQSTAPATAAEEQINITETEILTTNETISSDEDLTFSQTFTFTIVESSSQLSSSRITNDEGETLSIPRPIISAKLSATTQSECLRPISAGTYNGLPAYLLKLQFQFYGGQTWLDRIQSADINVVMKDAPSDAAGDGTQSGKRKKHLSKDAKHPSIDRVYPGPQGWKGPISSVPVATDKGTEIQVGWSGLGPSFSVKANVNQTRSRDETGSATVTTITTGGSQRNCLCITVKENPVDAHGILPYMVIPLIVTHHYRRFQMRVTVNATYGFWRGKLAESVPFLGRSDDPLFFDPKVIDEMMEAGTTRGGGVKVVERGGKLEELDLQEYTSLVAED